jgi:hypothetical protein
MGSVRWASRQWEIIKNSQHHLQQNDFDHPAISLIALPVLAARARIGPRSNIRSWRNSFIVRVLRPPASEREFQWGSLRELLTTAA